MPTRRGSSPWRALAWAWIGNAKRLALDPDGAEKAFAAADRWLPGAGPAATAELGTGKLVACELATSKAMLRWDQRRLEEALHLVDEAIDALGEAAPTDLLAQSLMVRGLVRHDLGDTRLAVSDLRRVLDRAEAGLDAFLRYEPSARETSDRELEALMTRLLGPALK